MNSTATTAKHPRYFKRFSRSQRLQHAIQIVTFSTLCFTGLLQKFSSSDTAETLIQLLGGVERMRHAHRVAAGIFVLEALYHALELAWFIVVRRSRLSMLPTWKDLRDAVQTFKYFIGLTTQRAQCDRFDFKQKVEYLSLIWGSIVMIVTGLVMWFPAQATTLVPGEVVAAARIAHGGEGLLACLVIFTWHMYSAHLAPEVFPIDKTIFTGLISESRMLHEHPLEYARIIAAEEELETLPDPFARAQPNLVSRTPPPGTAGVRRIQSTLLLAPNSRFLESSRYPEPSTCPAPAGQSSIHTRTRSPMLDPASTPQGDALELAPEDYLDADFDDPTGSYNAVLRHS